MTLVVISTHGYGFISSNFIQLNITKNVNTLVKKAMYSWYYIYPEELNRSYDISGRS